MRSYMIVRMYKSGKESVVLARGLTKEEAIEHCKDEETSSSTCDTLDSINHTVLYGEWFDGWEEE